MKNNQLLNQKIYSYEYKPFENFVRLIAAIILAAILIVWVKYLNDKYELKQAKDQWNSEIIDLNDDTFELNNISDCFL